MTMRLQVGFRVSQFNEYRELDVNQTGSFGTRSLIRKSPKEPEATSPLASKNGLRC